jgi:hypothetical protein
MHSRIAELLRYVEEQTAVLRAAYDAVPPDRRGVRPAPGRWSAAENVHHLAIVERGLARRLAALIEQARALPPETETTPVLTTEHTGRIERRTQRFVTSEAGTPKDTDVVRVWEDFDAARRGLIEVIRTGDGLALGAVSAPHPMLGPFTAYEWIAFAGAHAARHADQIREDQPGH